MAEDKSQPLLSEDLASPPPQYTPTLDAPTTKTTTPGARPPGPPRITPLALPTLLHLRASRVVLASASPRRKQLLSALHLPNLEVIPSNFEENIPKAGLTPYEYVLQTASGKCLASWRTTMDDEQRGEPACIIAADTVVATWDGGVLEKPRSERHHIDMLRALRDGGSGAGLSSAGSGRAYLSGEAAVEEEAAAATMGLGTGFRGEGVVGRGTGSGVAQTRDVNKRGWHKVFTAVAVLVPLESAKAPGYAMETVVEETGVRFDPNITDDLILAYVKTREGVDKAGGYGIQGMGSLLIDRIDGAWDNVVGMPVKATLQLVEKVMQNAKEDIEEDEADVLSELASRDLIGERS